MFGIECTCTAASLGCPLAVTSPLSDSFTYCLVAMENIQHGGCLESIGRAVAMAASATSTVEMIAWFIAVG